LYVEEEEEEEAENAGDEVAEGKKEGEPGRCSEIDHQATTMS